MQPITVSELGNYVKRIFRDDVLLSDVTVRGELSNFSQTAKGHCFFTIKDKDATLNCAMFRRNPDPTLPSAIGMEVVVTGQVNAYPQRSSYQLIASSIERRQAGSLYLELEKLKQKLKEEGLFEVDRRRAIPTIPSKIAILTSPTGAAIHDLLHVIRRRSPMTDILFFPVLVQGQNAPASMIEALTLVNEIEDVSTVIIGRGGGSFEDLFCFNDEELVRAVARSRHPIISAVGHESDTLLTDLVADLRAPTPTAAGEFATKHVNELLTEIDTLKQGLDFTILEIWDGEYEYLEAISEALRRQNPTVRIDQHALELGTISEALIRTVQRRQERYEDALSVLSYRLEASNPLSILQKGYAVVQKEGKIVSDARAVKASDPIEIRFHDSKLAARVESVYNKGVQDEL